MSIKKAIILLCSFCSVLAGCGGLLVPSYAEPEIIIIRNSSGMDIEEVELREAKSRKRAVRVGAISPLPKGVSQMLGRSTDPPRLPDEIMICWVGQTRQKICTQLELTKVLRASTGTQKALVFDIFSPSRVAVYLEEKSNINRSHLAIRRFI